MSSFHRVCGLAVAIALLAGCNSQPEGASENPMPEVTASAAMEAAGAGSTEAAPPSSLRPAQPPVAFQSCRSCHSVEPGRNGIGPTLHGLFGQKAASIPGFNYSPALKESGIIWDRASLDEWLAAPMKMVPGTRMVIGIPNEEARQSVIDYMETLK